MRATWHDCTAKTLFSRWTFIAEEVVTKAAPLMAVDDESTTSANVDVAKGIIGSGATHVAVSRPVLLMLRLADGILLLVARFADDGVAVGLTEGTKLWVIAAITVAVGLRWESALVEVAVRAGVGSWPVNVGVAINVQVLVDCVRMCRGVIVMVDVFVITTCVHVRCNVPDLTEVDTDGLGERDHVVVPVTNRHP